MLVDWVIWMICMKSWVLILILNDVSMVLKIVSKYNYYIIFVVNIFVFFFLICIIGWVEGMFCRVFIVFYVFFLELIVIWKMVKSFFIENMFIFIFMFKINCFFCLFLWDNFNLNRS